MLGLSTSEKHSRGVPRVSEVSELEHVCNVILKIEIEVRGRSIVDINKSTDETLTNPSIILTILWQASEGSEGSGFGLKKFWILRLK